tara:strand:- start:939 stop:1121 length:183 start_codon:yes stop_codon:yes gene_type:complete
MNEFVVLNGENKEDEKCYIGITKNSIVKSNITFSIGDVLDIDKAWEEFLKNYNDIKYSGY